MIYVGTKAHFWTKEVMALLPPRQFPRQVSLTSLFGKWPNRDRDATQSVDLASAGVDPAGNTGADWLTQWNAAGGSPLFLTQEPLA